jgi:single-strand DNA-binding protein
MYNKVILIGRLGKDPVVKRFSNDSAIAEFPLATSESYKDKEGNWNEITDWHNVKLPNKFMAERAEKSLRKGSTIFLEGKVKTRSYDDKDGSKKYITEIVVESFRMLDKKDEGSSVSNQANAPANTPTPPPTNEANNANNKADVDDDLPF